MNWTNIIIEDDTCQWNGRRMLFFQCQAHDVRPITRPGWYGSETVRCGADSSYIVSRTNPEGRTYTDHMCERHAGQWRVPPSR